MVGVKTVVPTAQHARGEVPHEGLGLEMKVAEHLVGPPTAEELDDVGVDVGAK